MEYQEFLDQVQAQPGPDNEEEALAATKATLGTLGERVTPGLREDIGSQLDERLAPFLTAYEGAVADESAVEAFDLKEFYRRVAVRANLSGEEAVMHARAVMTALGQALTPGEWKDMLSQLPDAYDDLMGDYPEPFHEEPHRPGKSYDVDEIRSEGTE